MKHVTRPGKLTIFNYKVKMYSYLKIKNYQLRMNIGKTLYNPYRKITSSKIITKILLI